MFLDWKRAQLLGPQSILHVLPCWKLHWKSFILIIQFQERPVWSHNFIRARRELLHWFWSWMILPIGSMYAIYGNIYHQYTPNVSIYAIHGSYGRWGVLFRFSLRNLNNPPMAGHFFPLAGQWATAVEETCVFVQTCDMLKNTFYIWWSNDIPVSFIGLNPLELVLGWAMGLAIPGSQLGY